MNRRTKIIVSVAGVFVVLLALLGITYGYFLTRVIGNTNDKSISITTANLSLVYNDGTTQILTRENIMPDTIVATKDFTVTNEGTADIEEYAIYLENVINTFTQEGQKDVKLRITCESNKGNTCNGYDSTYPATNQKLITNNIGIGETHTYELEVEYVETGNDQSADMGKILEGKIQIYDPRDVIAISGVVDITNPVENATYYVELHSDVKTSQIQSDGSYVFYGVKPEEHTLYVKYEKEAATTTAMTKTISVNKGSTSSVTSDGSQITMTNLTEEVKINIDLSNSKMTAGDIIEKQEMVWVDVSLVDLYNSGNLTINSTSSGYIPEITADAIPFAEDGKDITINLSGTYDISFEITSYSSDVYIDENSLYGTQMDEIWGDSFFSGEINEKMTITLYQGGITFTKFKKLVNKSDIADGEESSLVPGLYNESGELTKSWDELLSEEVIHVNNQVFSTNYDLYNFSNSSSDALVGHLVLPDDGSVTSLGYNALDLCENLEKLTIPKNITIKDGTFVDIYTFEVFYLGTKAEWVAMLPVSPTDALTTVHCTDGNVTYVQGEAVVND